mgnify:CR=1 FL=1
MEATRNLCAQIPISLHDRVREERESLGQVPQRICYPNSQRTF